VDDQEVVRETVAANLEDAGFNVLTAENGIEALALLESGEAVDVLVSDFSMPGMDGLTLIREAQIQRPGLLAVLLTGYASDSEDLKADHDSNGPLAIVQKPATVSQLVGGIEGLFADHQETEDSNTPLNASFGD
jgi:CheY-like chemotaxis protein